ncbi:hypothetical protein, partial [Xanthomonas campestris]|uniref:hypothetical protein n=1 Tax=Xanthomonas campestris TaxID=339 RepID=UPI003557DF9C
RRTSHRLTVNSYPNSLFPSPVASHFIVNPYPVLPSLTENAAYDYAKHWLATCYVSSRGSVSEA